MPLTTIPEETLQERAETLCEELLELEPDSGAEGLGRETLEEMQQPGPRVIEHMQKQDKPGKGQK